MYEHHLNASLWACCLVSVLNDSCSVSDPAASVCLGGPVESFVGEKRHRGSGSLLGGDLHTWSWMIKILWHFNPWGKSLGMVREMHQGKIGKLIIKKGEEFMSTQRRDKILVYSFYIIQGKDRLATYFWLICIISKVILRPKFNSYTTGHPTQGLLCNP